MQERIFDYYVAVLDATILAAKREGRYDRGVLDLVGSRIELQGDPQTLTNDAYSGAPTLLNVVRECLRLVFTDHGYWCTLQLHD